MPDEKCDCDCCRVLKTTLVGRQHQICRHESGLPQWKEDAYIVGWLDNMPHRSGLGDVVAYLIATLSFGLLDSKHCQPCNERKEKLNSLWRF